jgi:DNA adenine methylase
MRFLRYPGGKGRLLMFLADFLPESGEIDGNYVEPFLGGGSVFLYVKPERAVISDLNKELIDLYRGIRDYPHRVWETFVGFPTGKDAFYRIRDENYKDKRLYYRAARALYLNRTCFKGMWRHNPNGNFNVGYGGEERRWVITHKNIVELSGRFKRATIMHSDFERILDMCGDGDFVFLDPPYRPGERELSEAHYVYGKFSIEDQIRLSRKLRQITKKRIKWLMTNSLHDEICELYAGFNMVKVPIGTSGTIGVSTSDSKEVVISNY